MPILQEPLTDPNWIDPDDVPRPVVSFGVAMAEASRFELEPHRHRKGQIILVEQGALSCEVEGGLWIVPPRSAVWIPGGALHAIKVTGALKGYGAFVEPEADARQDRGCCAVSVTPLLRRIKLDKPHGNQFRWVNNTRAGRSPDTSAVPRIVDDFGAPGKSAQVVEWPGGLSPPGSPRTVREPLDSYGSRCSAVSMT
jgi:AraC-like ligand binding domain